MVICLNVWKKAKYKEMALLAMLDSLIMFTIYTKYFNLWSIEA